MNIIFTEEAKKYLEGKGDTIRVEFMAYGGGWCPVKQLPTVFVGKPQDEKYFNLYEVEEIKVYVPKNTIVVKDPVKIYVEGKWMFQRLEVEGLDIA